MTTVWWKIEALIPAENAIGGKACWLDGFDNEDAACAAFATACRRHPQCRLVRVTEEVSEQQDRFPVDAHGCSG